MSIQVQAISKTFAGVTVLDQVCLDFPQGQLTALLGPSGCGKTTLLRVIAGLETSDSGRVILEGEDASGTHVRERQVGFVFQHYALFRHMTVFENVAFGLRVKPRKLRPPEAEIRRRVMRLLDLVQMAWLSDRFPSQLSGGQRQRIALARALAVEPRVLLLDEPFGALDAKVRKELRRWLRSLHDELHVTSIFVTHDQEEALEVADRVVLMNRGRVEQVGSPAEVYEHPASPFVYSFLGAVNIFLGRVEGAHLRVGEATLPHEGSTFEQDATVVGFARPHELEIVTDLDSPHGLNAVVRRIMAFGGNIRVELDAIEDSPTGRNPAYYEVILPRERMQELIRGQRVRLMPQSLRVFEHQEA